MKKIPTQLSVSKLTLAIAGTMLPGTTTINGYEAVNITFPTFFDAITSLGAKARLI